MGFWEGFVVGQLVSSFSGGQKADLPGCLFYFELVVVATSLGVVYESWWIFVLAVAGLYGIMRIKYLFVPLLAALTICWGVIAYTTTGHYEVTMQIRLVWTVIALGLTGFAHYKIFTKEAG